ELLPSSRRRTHAGSGGSLLEGGEGHTYRPGGHGHRPGSAVRGAGGTQRRPRGARSGDRVRRARKAHRAGEGGAGGGVERRAFLPWRVRLGTDTGVVGSWPRYVPGRPYPRRRRLAGPGCQGGKHLRPPGERRVGPVVGTRPRGLHTARGVRAVSRRAVRAMLHIWLVFGLALPLAPTAVAQVGQGSAGQETAEARRVLAELRSLIDPTRFDVDALSLDLAFEEPEAIADW